MSDFILCEYLGISKLGAKESRTFNWVNPKTKHRQWVAAILGTCPKYGFKKEFLKFEQAPVKQNPKLRAFRWFMEEGVIYEYHNFMVDYLTDKVVSGFFMAVKGGIIPLEYDQVRTYLNMPVKKGKIVRLPSFQPPPGQYVDDDAPF